MTVIDRYVAKMFLSGYVILLLVGVGLYILTDLLVNIDEFSKDQTLALPELLRLVGDYYVCNLPLYYSQLGGPLMAIAAAFTLGALLRNNELTPLAAAGMPLQRLVVPIAVCSVFLVAMWMVNRELIMPRLAHKIAREHDDIIGKRTEGVQCARDDNNAILSAGVLSPEQGLLKRVFIIEPDAEGNPTHLVTADAARYDRAAKTWRLERGVRIPMYDPLDQPGLGRDIRPQFIDEYPFTLTPQQLALRRNSQWSDLLSISQINALLKSRVLANRPTIYMSLHSRLTQPLVQFVLLLLALPFFLTCEPTNVMAAGGKSLVIAGLFFLMVFVSQSVMKDESNAALITWFPILVFGPLAVLQLANVRT